MENTRIIAELDKEIARLQAARALLVGGSARMKATTSKRRMLSPDARKRISDAQKRRWKKARKVDK